MGRGEGVGRKRRKGGRGGEKMGESRRKGRRKEWREREILTEYLPGHRNHSEELSYQRSNPIIGNREMATYLSSFP